MRLPMTPISVAKHALWSLDGLAFAPRNMAFGPSKAKLSQLERCLTANPLAVFVLSKGQISSFRPLVRPFFPHNFLTKYPYKHMVAPDP